MVLRRLAFALALIACSGGGSPEPSFVPPPTNPGGPRTHSFISVVNRTEAPVVLQVRVAPELQIDRRVLLGDLAVPIAPAPFIAMRTEVVRPGSSATLSNDLLVLDPATTAGKGPQPVIGGIVGFENGPSTLAVGTGIVLIRSADDGSLFLEAEDPRTVSLVPVEREVPSCGEAELGTRIEGLPPSITPLTEAVAVTGVARDASGCRVFEPANVRACLPDEAYPFAEDDTLTIGPAFDPATASVRIENQAGVSLQLSRFGAEPGRLGVSSEMTIAVDVDTKAKCASVDPTCGDVIVPLLTELRFGPTVVTRPALRAAIPVPEKPNRTLYVLGAFARPIALTKCDARPAHETFFAADLFVATVER